MHVDLKYWYLTLPTLCNTLTVASDCNIKSEKAHNACFT